METIQLLTRYLKKEKNRYNKQSKTIISKKIKILKYKSKIKSKFDW